MARTDDPEGQTQISLTMPRELAKRLRRAADDNDTSRPELVRIGIGLVLALSDDELVRLLDECEPNRRRRSPAAW